MSSEEAKVPDPSQPMTIGMFQTALANIGEEVKEAFRIRDDASQKQGEQIQQQLNQFASTLREIVDYVKRPSDQAVSRDPSGKVAEYSNNVQMVAQAIAELKNLISPNVPGEFDKYTQLRRTAVERQILAAEKRAIFQYVKSKWLYPDEVEAVLDEKLSRGAIEHGP